MFVCQREREKCDGGFSEADVYGLIYTNMVKKTYYMLNIQVRGA